MKRPRSQHLLLIVFTVLIIAVNGCATIMQGSSQEMSISSSPTGAKVLVDGAELGTTPYTASLKRKDKHVVRIEMDTYQPYEISLARATSGWVWGNLVFGGIPGLAIDAITGSMYKLKPEDVFANLALTSFKNDDGNDVLMVMVVLTPDPTWEHIGSLVRK